MSEIGQYPSHSSKCPDSAPSGFDFSNHTRNTRILNSKCTVPHATKTGTTIVGLVYKGGVVLGCDTRATSDTEVADKNCAKIHYLASNIQCCGAGTAADTEKTTQLVESQLELLRLNTKTSSRCVTAVTMLKRMLFKYQGHIGAALILGGCDVTGANIYLIYPNGCTMKVPYGTMGSGSLAAMSVFELGWKEDMEETEAVDLVKKAIMAGIWNDLGSGSNCDTYVIRLDGTSEFKRGAVTPNDVAPLRAKIQRSSLLTMKNGTTSVLKEEVYRRRTGPVTLDDVMVTDMET